MGALQALQENGILTGPKRADYLSAVSGGSYIATAVTLVAQGACPGSRVVKRRSAPPTPSPEVRPRSSSCATTPPTSCTALVGGWPTSGAWLYELSQCQPPHLPKFLSWKSFPCDPTSNQLYTARRFDAYRALGYFSTCRAIADPVAPRP